MCSWTIYIVNMKLCVMPKRKYYLLVVEADSWPPTRLGPYKSKQHQLKARAKLEDTTDWFIWRLDLIKNVPHIYY
jgi:hypothetical protein